MKRLKLRKNLIRKEAITIGLNTSANQPSFKSSEADQKALF